MRSTGMLVCLLALLRLSTAYGADLLKLPLEDNLGFTPQNFNQSDGTQIAWVEFFTSATSHVAVGRSTIHGRLLPAANLEYTDCFYVAKGSSSVTVAGRDYHLRAGDIVLLPRGARVEGHNFKHYIHFAASFETGPGVSSNGPLELRQLRPDRLKYEDFTVEGNDMRHVYYQGHGGVVVRAWQSKAPDLTTDFFAAPWSELSFIVSGRGTITSPDGAVRSLRAGDAVFIAKGQRIKLSTHHLRKLEIVFDQASGGLAQ